MKKREVVSSLATRYYCRLAQRAGGILPPVTAERAWRGLAESMRIEAGPLPRPCPKGFNARLFFHRGVARWFIVYTPDAPPRQRCEMICHELVEYMTHQDFGPVIDRAPRYAFAYDGGARPGDIRHQISLAVTRMAFGGSLADIPRPSGGSDAQHATGRPVLDALLQTGQLHFASDLPVRDESRLASDPPVREQGFPASDPAERRPSRTVRWPHQSGRCRCGCRGTLHRLLEE